jgi:hypothetical protein
VCNSVWTGSFQSCLDGQFRCFSSAYLTSFFFAVFSSIFHIFLPFIFLLFCLFLSFCFVSSFIVLSCAFTFLSFFQCLSPFVFLFSFFFSCFPPNFCTQSDSFVPIRENAVDEAPTMSEHFYIMRTVGRI